MSNTLDSLIRWLEKGSARGELPCGAGEAAWQLTQFRTELAAANERAEKAINPPQVYIPDPTDTDPDVHQDIASVEWHEGGVTHIFSAEAGEVSYLKLGPGEELVNVKWTDPAVAARDAEIARLKMIVGKLPKTVDGVTIVPGMTLHNFVRAGYLTEDKWSTECDFLNFDVTECYSTRQAAETAQAAEAARKQN